VASVGPGIFTDQTGAVVPSAIGSRNQDIAIYITGAGAVSPGVSTGAAPDAATALANLPQPSQQVTVTVGGQGPLSSSSESRRGWSGSRKSTSRFRLD